jgi:hypothetical protein
VCSSDLRRSPPPNVQVNADMRRAGVASVLALLAFAVHAAAGQAWGVAELMQRLAHHPGGRALFVERKYLAVLDRPVESSGELLFTPPSHMEKRTLKPKPELLVLEGDNLTVERDKRRYTLALSQYPEVGAFVDSIRATLAGDLAALHKAYRVELDGDAARWTLTLLPSDTKMAAVVLRIRIAGREDEVRSIEILQADGDRSLMTIDKAETR